MPPRLLLLDAPDVDSDVTVNWERARAIRQTADVLVAVLTQQKYNDAAVKQFFRAAVEADKPIVVIFNLCDLEEDRPYWPAWLATFCQQTGARPELVYVAPYDRAAAEGLRLPFYRRRGPPVAGRTLRRRRPDLRDELASLHFDAIKIRTFRGAVGRVLDRRAARRPTWRRSAGRRANSPPRPRPCRPPRWRGGLAHAPRRRAGGRNPPLVGRRAQQLVAASPRLLSPAGPRRDLAGPGRLAIAGGSQRRAAGRLPPATSGRRSCWPWKNCWTNSTGCPAWATRRCARG